jgi:hypothetical protein
MAITQKVVPIDFNNPVQLNVYKLSFADLTQQCHAASYNRGWWHDPITGLSLIPYDLGSLLANPIADHATQRVVHAWFPYIIATKIALIHSEVSEMLEAFRTDKMDDHIPFLGVVAEGADVFIRLFDLFGCLQAAAAEGIVVEGEYRVIETILAKIPYNGVRKDHDFKNRKKKF